MKNFQKLDISSIRLEGRNLIEASAGTGKTFAISNIYLRLVTEKGFDVNSILVVTFTEAATKELRERIRKVLCDAAKYLEDPNLADAPISSAMNSILQMTDRDSVAASLRKAIINFDEAAIFTIHGFCSRVLRDNSFESSMLFDTELVADQAETVKDILMDFRRIFLDTPFKTAAADASGFTIARQKSLASEFERKPLLEIIPHEEDIDLGYLEELCSGFASKNDGIFSTSAIAEKIKAPAKKRIPGLNEGLAKFRNMLIIKFKAYLEKELPARKRVLNIRHYSDILSDLWIALGKEGGNHPLSNAVREKYKAVMIDEFQDTDPLQYDIFNRLFGSGSHIMFMIGDPKQSIYGFRNADIFAYLDAAESTADEKRFTMDSNWRSSSSFIKALNTIFDSIENPFVLGENISYPDVHAALDSKGNRNKLMVCGVEDAAMEVDLLDGPYNSKGYMNTDAALELAASHTAEKIAEMLSLAQAGKALIGNRPLRASDIAILVMKHDHCGILQKYLGRYNIPAVFQKTGDIYHSVEASELETVLTGILAPGSTVRLNAALATPLCGFTDSEILGFTEDESKVTDYEKHIEQFSYCLKLWREYGFYRMFRQFSSFYKLREKILSMAGGERKLTNILHLAELLHEYSISNKTPPENLLEYLARKRTDDECNEENELRLERDDEAVQIMTVFRSKGLQFPLVFCPFLWHKKADPGDSIIFRKDGKTCFDIGSGNPENKIVAQWESLAELMRLFYVALTRAQNKCVFSWGRINQTEKTALSYFSVSGASGSPQEILDKAEALKAMQPVDLRDKLAELELASGRKFRIANAEEKADQERLVSGTDEKNGKLSVKKIPESFRVITGSGITSFSSMTKNTGHSSDSKEAEKMDEPLAEKSDFLPRPSGAAGSFIDFPRGANPGQCVHSILEGLDFAAADMEHLKKLAEQKLSEFGLSGKDAGEQGKRISQLSGMIAELIDIPLVTLKNETMFLRETKKGSMVSELEFHFPASSISMPETGKLFEKHSDLYSDKSFPDRITGLQSSVNSGFMHGYADLIFEKDGKYYIVDWKTNYLGPSLEDYNSENLMKAMEDSFYILQYSLYLAALCRFLRSKIVDFSYEKHIGGIFYIFLRGIAKEKPGNGVFYSLPKESFIDGLEEIFSGGKKK